MFAEKVHRLDELHGILPDTAIEVLRDILGTSGQPLRHDGSLILGGPRAAADGDPTDYAAPPDAAVGPEALRVLAGSDANFLGRPLGITKWAEATEDSETRVNRRTGKTDVWVKARACKNQYGEGLTGPEFEILVAPNEVGAATVSAGSPLAYTYDEQKTRITHSLFAGGSSGFPAVTRWAKAVAGWEWEEGQRDLVGTVEVVEVTDIYGLTEVGDDFTLRLRATTHQDPNVQLGDVIEWGKDRTGMTVATDGHLDAKVGTIDALKAGADMPGGWKPYYEDLGGRFLVAHHPEHTEFADEHATGGRHPIRPAPHDDDEPQGSTVVWKTDYTGDWYRTAWNLHDHPSKPTSLAATGIEIVGVSLNTENEGTRITVEPHTLDVLDAVTGIGMHQVGLGTSFVSLSTISDEKIVDVDHEEITVQIQMHKYHTHAPPQTVYVVDAVGGLSAGDIGPGHSTGETGETDAHTHPIAVGGAEEIWRLVPSLLGIPEPDARKHEPWKGSHDHDTQPHYHQVAMDPHKHNVQPARHLHPIVDPGHDHDIAVEGQAHTVNDPGHAHGMNPDPHTHGIIDPTHRHYTEELEHEGSLHHRTEDYRPNWGIIKLKIRVGPEED